MSEGISWSTILDKIGGSQAFEPLPANDYDVRIAESSAVRASTGKPMIKIRFEVVAGPYSGKKFFHNFVITTQGDNMEKAMAVFFRNMRTLGLDEGFFRTNPPIEGIAKALLGKVCRVSITHREWQGQINENVTRIQPASAATNVSLGTPAQASVQISGGNGAPVPTGLPPVAQTYATPASVAPAQETASQVTVASTPAPSTPAYEPPTSVSPPTLPPPPPLPS